MDQVQLVDPSSGRNLAAEELARLCSRDPDALALAEPEREITVGELIAQARARAGQLIAQGVTPGSRLIVARPNVIEFVVDVNTAGHFFIHHEAESAHHFFI